MPKKRKQRAGKQGGEGPSGRRGPLHRAEALALVAKQTRRNFAEEVERLEERIQQDKERMGPGWTKSFVDDELNADPEVCPAARVCCSAAVVQLVC